MQDLGEFAVSNLREKRVEALLSAYAEVCKSYHAVDEFRMKLLGLLPLASLLGIVLLKRDGLMLLSSGGNQLVGFVSIFAAAFTLALFLFEIRGILRCSDLIGRGRQIEEELRVQGQFWVCAIEAECARRRSSLTDWIAFVFNATVAVCVIYSVVFAAWAFVALRYGYGVGIWGCALSGVALGLLLAAGAYAMVRKLIAA
jgi:hypothetical protein